MISLIVPVVIVALIFGGFYYWARRQGLPATGHAAEGEQGTRRISLLTEAVAYVGVILLLAGGAAAIGQRWDSLGDWGQVGVLAAAAVFFLLIGIVVRRVREPAIQRLAGVVWFLSVACTAGACLARVVQSVREHGPGHGPRRGGCHRVLGGAVAGPSGCAAKRRLVRGPGRHHPRHC